MVVFVLVCWQVPNTAGKKALAMEAYARGLRQLPTIIADNGGYDGSDLISSLRAAHAQGDKVRREQTVGRSGLVVRHRVRYACLI